ncbi:MAG: glucose-6-phosphate dehydrogenase, partial [Rhizobiales bacterium]|nr:glucose-6-phosphate dehydrogenase [Hyphomicrobiales bacterium]
MTSRIIAVDPFNLVVFGGAGDLAFRKLIPAMYHRHRDGQLPAESGIYGVSRRAMSDDEYRKAAGDALKEHVAAEELEPDVLDAFLQRLHFVSIDVMKEGEFERAE